MRLRGSAAGWQSWLMKEVVVLFPVILLFLPGCTTAPVSVSSAGSAPTEVVENIYVARSLRESRVAATEFCAQARVGFGEATVEDQYTFRSIATRVADGLMVDANVKAIGSGRGCFGRTADPAVSNFYLEGVLGGAAFKGTGECRRVKGDYPEPGISVYRCFLDIRDLPAGYVGGQLTTNTVNSRNITGEKTDPPGYTQPSIATIRLWKRR